MPEHVPVLVVQHEDDCPPGWFGSWLEQAGCALDVRRPYVGEPLPNDLTGHRALLVLGGSMGANDDESAPWLEPTRALIREAVATQLPAFGICLGHQLTAVALGGEVSRNPRGQQLGVLPIGWVEGQSVLGARPGAGFQWNDDVVRALPPGATALARTAAGELQAVQYAPAVWGVQVHPEVDRGLVASWVEEDRPDRDPAAMQAALVELEERFEELAGQWRPVAEDFAALALGTP